MMLFGATPKELTRALALHGAAAPAGGTAGVFLGGVITEYLSWPWVFYLNVPIALIVLAAIPTLMPGGAARRGGTDIAGAVTVTLGLAVAVVLLSVFLVLQAKRRNPLVRLGIFRTPDLAAANLAQLLLGAAWSPMWFFLNLYLQQVLGLGAFASGSALLPMTTVIMLLMIAVAPRLMTRFGAKAMVVAGLAVLAIGLGWLSLARPTGTFWIDVLPASLVAAAGMALAFVPSLGTAISSARPEEGGLASGIVNTSYQVGSALGLAAMTALASSLGADQLADTARLTDGLSAAFLGAAGIAAAGTVAAVVTLRRHRVRDAEAVTA